MVSTSAVPPGANQTITAIYAGNSSFNGSTGQLTTFTVNKGTVSTAVTGSLSNSVFGQSVTFTATVSSPVGTPTGTVTFTVDGMPQTTTATLSGGKATATLNNLAAGSHSIGANYNGDANFAASTNSTPASLTVGPASTTTTIVASTANAVAGQLVTFTATVAPVSPGGGVPTGSIGFVVDGNYVTSGTTLDATGKASMTLSFGVGTHHVGAIYTPSNGNYSGSFTPVSPVLLWAPVNVTQASTTTTIATTLSSSLTIQTAYGQPVTFYAVVSPTAPGGGTPTGTVTFLLDTNQFLPPVTLVNGVAVFTTNTLTPGVHYMAAIYNGDSNYAGSYTPASPTLLWVKLTVTQAFAPVTVTATPTASVYGQTVTITATVSPLSQGAAVPTGQVVFYIDGVAASAGTLNSAGVATYSVAFLPEGFHTVSAVYNGDSNYMLSYPLTQTPTIAVYAVPTYLTATVNAPGGVFVNQGFSITATVLDGQGLVYPLSNFPATLQVLSAPPGGSMTPASSLSATVQNGVVTFGASAPLVVNVAGAYKVRIIVGNLILDFEIDTVGRQT
jgi:hypothetical protein